MKVIITSNTTKIAQRYRRMARNMPGLVQQAVHDLVQTEAVPLFQNTTRTWVQQPTFTSKQTPRGWTVIVDPPFPYGWVNRGTRIRYATMSKDWKSKTKPNVIASYAGRGRVLFISRKRPRPGIVARNFSDIITRRIQTRAAAFVRDRLNEASYGAGTGI